MRYLTCLRRTGVIVDDEVQFLLGKAVVPGENAVDFVEN
jgi:hypothetical protein